jgi:hypothetical protein
MSEENIDLDVEETIIEDVEDLDLAVEEPTPDDSDIKQKTKGLPKTVDSKTDSSVIGSSTTDRKAKTNKPGSVSNTTNGAIGSSSANNANKPKKSDGEGKIAVFSTRNVTWPGLGSVVRGYNIVSEEAAKKWATRNHIRVATPEEVAKEFGL